MYLLITNKIPLYSPKVVLLLFLFAILKLNTLEAKSNKDSEQNFEQLMSLSLEQLINLKVDVGSNVATSQIEQPVTISTISQNQIKLSGARTVNELISLLTPGYFLVEDQDDTIAGFRGLAPDNNSKVLLLLNGNSLNTEWFWGPPDALLNSLDMDFIDRIEIIRGPGSVTQGQGALLGVINIVTSTSLASELHIARGADGLAKHTFHYAKSFEQGAFSIYLSDGEYVGNPMANRGWTELRSEQGLSVFQRQHHLHASEYTTAIFSAKYEQWQGNLFRFNQSRNLYNFFRDREVVEQTLTGFTLQQQYKFDQNISLKTSLKYLIDDYFLSSHGRNIPAQTRELYESSQSNFSDVINSTVGADRLVTPEVVMGGTRETRYGLKMVLNIASFSNHKMAMGFDHNVFKMGQENNDGINFIINEQIQRLGLISDGAGGIVQSNSPNQNNTWVNPDEFSIFSLFFEDYYTLTSNTDLFAAFHWDDHPNWGHQISPRIGIHIRHDQKHFWRMSWQTGFRGAVGVQTAGGFIQDGFLAENNFDAVNQVANTFADFDFDGDPSNDTNTLTPLKPETIATFEISHQYVEDALQIRSVIFHNTVEDILAAQAHGYVGLNFGDTIGSDQLGTWGGNWYYQNQQGKLTQAGVEIEIDYSVNQWKFSASHSNVTILSADQGVIGPYVLEGKKIAAYPANITRFRTQHAVQNNWAEIHWGLTGLYYWNYYEPAGERVDGGEMINVGISLTPKQVKNMEISLIAKNITDNDSLYPINTTGDANGARGTPSIEPFGWWLSLKYQF